MIKYFSIDQTPVEEFDEWVGVLNLATKWLFQEVRGSLLFFPWSDIYFYFRFEQKPFRNLQTLLKTRVRR
jgi:hypothetical protein